MTQEEIITKTRNYIKHKFTGENTGHDWWHMYRVWKMTRHLVSKEPSADPFVAELAALLHDIADWKFHDGDEEAGPRAARAWLESLDAPEEAIAHVESIVRNVSFKGAHVKQKLDTIEGRITFDADKLDAIGAIGIARTFAYGGAVGRPIHNPERSKAVNNYSSGSTSSASIDHFAEKLLLLSDRLYTPSAKAIAQKRHAYMEEYLKEFYAEWDVKI